MYIHTIEHKIKACLLAVLSLVIVSCESTEEETIELNNQACISSVTLGTIKRTIMVTDTLGQIVPSNTTYTASDVRMSIDQRNRTIENLDSLLYGSKVSRVLVNIKYTGKSLHYRVADNDTAEWTMYSASDSIDLNKPIRLRVTASDEVGETYYTLKVNVHQQDGDSMKWNHTTVAEDLLGDLTDIKAFTLNGKVAVLGQASGSIQLVMPNTEGTWQKQATNLPADANLRTLHSYADKAYISTAEGRVFYTEDGTTWSEKGAAVEGLQLIAVTYNRLYALVGNTLRHADLEASNWDGKESLGDEKAEDLPTKIQDGIFYTQSNGTKRVILIGENTANSDSTYVVWSKSWNDDKKQDATAWMYYNQDGDNTFACPRLEGLSVFLYDNILTAVGGNPIKGFSACKALDYFYVSKDQGLTWRQEESVRIPEELIGTTTPIASTIDSENYIWIVTGCNVWQGRLNRLGFARP